jgi:hypothetical protein
MSSALRPLGSNRQSAWPHRLKITICPGWE